LCLYTPMSSCPQPHRVGVAGLRLDTRRLPGGGGVPIVEWHDRIFPGEGRHVTSTRVLELTYHQHKNSNLSSYGEHTFAVWIKQSLDSPKQSRPVS
jgi:hypothetical protein